MEQDGQFGMTSERREEMTERKYSATLVAPEGLGFGEGGIGVQDRLNDEADPLTLEGLETVDRTIDSDDILVEVDEDKNGKMLDDDGCGDGRGVKRIFQGVVQKVKSLNRSKIFGGAPVMVSAALIGLGKATGSLNDVFKSAIGRLHDKSIDYGAHSGSHAHGKNCGCGAIDQAPAITKAAIEKREQITGVIETLGLDTAGLGEIFGEYDEYVASQVVGKEEEYSGVEAYKEVVASGRVNKELDGDHAEVRIILNMVHGKTVNQELIRQVSNEAAQVFAVDVWRLQDVANRAFETKEERHKAFLSMLVHTLAVSSVLTKGDLPVYIINEVPKPADQSTELATV
jgi:hypothetical protein